MKTVRPGRLPMQLEKHYADISWQPVVNSTWFASDSPADMGLYARDCAAVLRGLFQTTEDEALSRAEMDNVPRLFCNWRNKGMFPFVYDDQSLRVRGRAQMHYLRDAIAAISSKILTALRSSLKTADFRDYVANAPFPVNKGKGAPFWATGSNRLAAPALIALAQGARTFDELEERCHEVGAGLPIVITLYTRIQAAKKEREVMAADSLGRPVKTGSLALLPKVRKVQAVSLLINYSYVKVGAALLEVARNLNIGILPRIEHVMERTRGIPPELIFAEDISNYDDSVTLETWTAASQSLTQPALRMVRAAGLLDDVELSRALSVEERIPTLPILTPPLRFGTAAQILNREGAIPSGIRLTSLIGSVINNARIRSNLRLAGVAAVRDIFTFGDDTLIVFTTLEDRKRYEAKLEAFKVESGFTTTVADDASFLMRRVPANYGYLSRMIMSTLQKEDMREPRTLPIAALGVAARKAVLTGHPYAKTFDVLLADGACGPRYAAAYRLAESQGFNAAALGLLVGAGVGSRSAKQAVRMHSLEEIEHLIADIREVDPKSAEALEATFGDQLRAAKPSIRVTEEMAQSYRSQGKPDYAKIRDVVLYTRKQ